MDDSYEYFDDHKQYLISRGLTKKQSSRNKRALKKSMKKFILLQHGGLSAMESEILQYKRGINALERENPTRSSANTK